MARIAPVLVSKFQRELAELRAAIERATVVGRGMPIPLELRIQEAVILERLQRLRGDRGTTH
jgi:hypothetical protein